MPKPAPRITRSEPEGPLRTGLRTLAGSLGPAYGADVFKEGHALATGGLDAVLDMQERRLGDSNISIPRTTHVIQQLRREGAFMPGQTHDVDVLGL
jgi:hypothetical protein